MSHSFATDPSIVCLPALPGHSWGAVPGQDGHWHFALWAPSAGNVTVQVANMPHIMQRDDQGVFRATLPAEEGAAYFFEADGVALADPASRWQMDGVEGASRLLNPASLRFGRAAWQGRPFNETVICEIHIGTFTPEGTFAAAAASDQLRRLADLGVTAIELMPLGQFPGRQGWGYDTVLPGAPQSSYGSPRQLCALIDRVHELGMMVYLDVVFNHFGPQGCYLMQICPQFFNQGQNDWGRAINFAARPVRDYFLDCALGWLEDYGFDGLRLDASDQIIDSSAPEFLVELARTIRARIPDRPIHLMTEDNRNITRLHEPVRNLYDGEWNDDYHHALHVLLTAETFKHYKPFKPDPLGDLCLALRDGYVLQGQPRADGDAPKGEPSGHLPWRVFINFNLNHDQAGNRARGSRLVSLVGHETALVSHALLLSAPFTPLLFMGEEVGSEAPFPWIADYAEPMAGQMRQGRKQEYAEMPGFAERMTDPMDSAAWASCHPYARLPLQASSWLAETRRLLQMRREVLLPLYRSGRAGAPQAEPIGKAALRACWPCASGVANVALCFDGTTGFSDPALTTCTYALRCPGEGQPWFRLWIS